MVIVIVSNIFLKVLTEEEAVLKPFTAFHSSPILQQSSSTRAARDEFIIVNKTFSVTYCTYLYFFSCKFLKAETIINAKYIKIQVEQQKGK